MSYVEKAFYRYLKSIFTTGFKVLFSKKYIIHTLTFVLISLTSTAYYALQRSGTLNVEKSVLELTSKILIDVELSFAVTFIVFGLFFSRLPFKIWFGPALITAAGGSVLLYYFPQIAPYLAALCYLTWIFISVFLTFSFSRNFWGNKVLGSIMFLGKPSDQGSILFAGIVFIFGLVNAGMSIYLILKGVELNQMSLVITAAFALAGVLLIFLIVFVLGKYDDVFYTILAFFYIFASFTLWKITFYIAQGKQASDNVGSVIIAFFLVIYTVSNYGKKVEKIEQQISEQVELEEELKKAKKKKRQQEIKEQWLLLKLPTILGPEGVLMTVMGLVLGYHVTLLQFLSAQDLFSEFNLMTKSEIAGIRDKIAVILLPALIVFFILSYIWSDKFRYYASPELYRFEFLPPFEELMEKIEKIRTGEEDWKSYAMLIVKEGLKIGVKSAAKKAIIAPKNAVVKTVSAAYSGTKRTVSKGVKKLFKGRKKEK